MLAQSGLGASDSYYPAAMESQHPFPMADGWRSGIRQPSSPVRSSKLTTLFNSAAVSDLGPSSRRSHSPHHTPLPGDPHCLASRSLASLRPHRYCQHSSALDI
ncbi:hypothetical protein ACJQWK_03442 [Exserohilum turcicum]